MGDKPKKELVKCTCIYPECGKVFYAETFRYYCSPTCEQKNVAQFFQDRPPPFKPSQRRRTYQKRR